MAGESEDEELEDVEGDAIWAGFCMTEMVLCMPPIPSLLRSIEEWLLWSVVNVYNNVIIIIIYNKMHIYHIQYVNIYIYSDIY